MSLSSRPIATAEGVAATGGLRFTDALTPTQLGVHVESRVPGFMYVKIIVDASTAVNVVARGATTVVYKMNDGVPLRAGIPYTLQPVPIDPDATSYEVVCVTSCTVTQYFIYSSAGDEVVFDPGRENRDVPGLDPSVQFFENAQFGTDMAQPVVFTGTPEIIFEDGAEWTETDVLGFGRVTFNGGKVTLTAAEDQEQALFGDSPDKDMDLFAAVTGNVNLTAYNGDVNTITIGFRNSGSPVGNVVPLNGIIVTTDFGVDQSFAINKAAFGITNQLINEFVITIERSSGPKPTLIFDDIQIEESGSPLSFTAQAQVGQVLRVNDILFEISNPSLTLVLTDGSASGLDSRLFIGLPSLLNGVVFIWIRSEVVQFAIPFRNISDFMSLGTQVREPVFSVVAFTEVIFDVVFPETLNLYGDNLDRLVFIVSDDLGDLSKFEASARGAQDA